MDRISERKELTGDMVREVVILAIESSCDDTSAAVIRNETILSNVVASQKVHEAYGGVVPELASRAHQQNIIPVVDVALKRAGVSRSEISAVAFTRGPGLLGSLLVGTSFAKAFALALGVPLIEVNHLQAHVLALFIREPGMTDRADASQAAPAPAQATTSLSAATQSADMPPVAARTAAIPPISAQSATPAPAQAATSAPAQAATPAPAQTATSAPAQTATSAPAQAIVSGPVYRVPSFPFLCLLVSGGNSQIILVRDHLHMEVIGQTIDDAAGEAFDKCAKVMGLPYPGGPYIDKLAKEGNPHRFPFTKPAISGLDYSFSGLKTNFLYFLRDQLRENPGFIEQNKADLAASLQKTIIDILLQKLTRAAKETRIRDIAIAGGVSANSGLRNAIQAEAQKRKWNVFIPKFEFTMDNAAMIAIAGYYKYLRGEFAGQDAVPYSRTHL
ncbi:MAG TPA: tRNA (adenosine(37)-N6)-threonylcarbamoyltransferase complex transferase subunit TsaD, partial [Prolixibacteraceae bacterium]|nr:tRNA (adenosine(37)-N6)-threonylcarbamoyltransferase complex transferase subunit TsaD [Prolixibacteraceae bacterium]